MRWENKGQEIVPPRLEVLTATYHENLVLFQGELAGLYWCSRHRRLLWFACHALDSTSSSPSFFRATNRFWRLLENLPDPAESQSLLKETIQEAESLYFVVHAILSCQRGSGGSFLRTDDLGRFRQIASDRLPDHYIQRSCDIFAKLPESDWGFILYQWGTDWMTNEGRNRDNVQGYVLSLIDRKPEYLGTLLLHWGRGSSSKEQGFRWDEFCQIYDPEARLERLNRYGERAFSNPEQREAAERFRQTYSLRRSNADEAQEPVSS